MEITVAQGQVLRLIPRIDLERARERVEEKKISLVAGTVGALFSHPKPEDIVLTHSESRLEPFWQIVAEAHLVYERQRSYTVAVDGSDVKRVTLYGQDLEVTPAGSSGGRFTCTGTEHCEGGQKIAETFDSRGTPESDLAPLLTNPSEPVADLDAFRPEGVLLLAPEAGANLVLGHVVSQLARPRDAQSVLEDRFEVEAITLCLRPVYAFEFQWPQKSKFVVVEFDGLSGEIRTGRSKKEQARPALSYRELFDVSADALTAAAGTAIPRDNVAVKLMKSLVDTVRK